MMAKTHTGLEGDIILDNTLNLEKTNEVPKTWNIEVFVSVIQELVKKLFIFHVKKKFSIQI